MINSDMFYEDKCCEAKQAINYAESIFLGNTAECMPEPFPVCPKKEEGKNPMRYDTVTVAPSISIDAPAGKSEIDTQREYLINRLYEISKGIRSNLRKDFHLDGPHSPWNYKQLIDAIKNDKFKLTDYAKEVDEAIERKETGEDRWFDYGVFAGIEWTDFPKADYKGFDKAVNALEKARTDTVDIIMVSDAKAGLEALKAFEAWKPTKDTDTAQ